MSEAVKSLRDMRKAAGLTLDRMAGLLGYSSKATVFEIEQKHEQDPIKNRRYFFMWEGACRMWVRQMAKAHKAMGLPAELAK